MITHANISKFPRRNDTLQMTPEELAIRDVIHRIESLGAHPLLTEVVTLMSQAKDKLADWIETTPMYGSNSDLLSLARDGSKNKALADCHFPAAVHRPRAAQQLCC